MKLSTRQMALVGVLGAMTVALGILPVGGFIPVPTPAGSATTMHIPTILAGIFEGPIAGAIVGAIFGGFSFWKAQVSPNPLEKLMFTNPLIAFLPRMLIGVLSHYVYILGRGSKGRIVLMGLVAVIFGHTGYWALAGQSSALRLIGTALIGFLGVAAIYIINQRNDQPGPALGALSGSLTNTVGVMGLSGLFGYLPAQIAVAVGITHGIPEAAVAMVLTDLIYRGTRSIRR